MMMTHNILLTGASGMLGKAVASALSTNGIEFSGSGRHDARPGFLGNWVRADVLTGSGLDAAVHERSCIIHCASTPAKPGNDIIALRNVIAAARAQNTHILYIGIAGIEEAAKRYAYYKAKLECERILAESGLPYTILRASPFHPFVDTLLRRLTFGPFLLVPQMTLQPVDIQFVAETLTMLSIERPIGRLRDVFGPEALDTLRLIDIWFAAKKGRKSRIPMPAIGSFVGLTDLKTVEGMSGGASWSEWVAQHRQ
jgi:uncharacterized protein YbjT (DUF2867 family)